MARTPRAPRLVHKDPSTGQLVLNEDTLRDLRSILGPVAVVAICGGARKGKSSLLTRIMECQGAVAQSFEASPEVDPCTKGLHISTLPVPAEDKEGVPYSLLFLDTEGIDSTDQDRRDMCQVFSLCVLLSSVVLLNEVGSISESTLDMLSLVSEVTGIVRATSTDGTQRAAAESPSGTPEEDQEALDALTALSYYSPMLCWVLRDFSLRLRGGMGPTEYMEQALQALPEEGRRAAAMAEKNRVRRCIKALFPVRQCFTLVRPIADEELLQESHQLCLEDLRSQFQDEVKHLAQAVCTAATPPAVSGVRLTGPLLAFLCESYVAAMNGGAVPDIKSMHLTALEDACAKAKDIALQLYETYQGMFASPDPEAMCSRLNEVHGTGAKFAFEKFREETRNFPKEAVGPSEGELQKSIQEKFDHFSAEMRAKAAAQAKKRVLESAGVGFAAGGALGCALVADSLVAATTWGAALAAAGPAGLACGFVGSLIGAGVGIFKSVRKCQPQKESS